MAESKIKKASPCVGHKGICRTGGMVPFILKLGIRRWWVVSFKNQPLYPSKRAPSTQCTGRYLGPEAGVGALEKLCISWTVRDSNTYSSVIKDRSLPFVNEVPYSTRQKTPTNCMHKYNVPVLTNYIHKLERAEVFRRKLKSQFTHSNRFT